MMLSRIADSLFWLNRYMERADSLLRLLYTHFGLALDTDIHGNLTWKPVLEILTNVQGAEMERLENSTEEVLHKILLEGTNYNSLRIILNKARENARGIQDHITKEVWEEVNQIYHLINHPAIAQKLHSNQGIETIELFQRHTVLYTGITEITMSRGTGWQFMNLGKLVERCLHTLQLTEKQLQLLGNTPLDDADILQWRYLLLALSGYELHLKTYRSGQHSRNALHQVLLNDNFTRSVVYTLNHMEVCLQKISERNRDEDTRRMMRRFGQLHSKVKFLDPDSLDDATLRTLLPEIKSDLLQFSKSLGQQFFSYS
ncbi:alpha-E domain-containing protein [Cnuella takakiae]|nr:alpha-E domain-containing protein [Cnuella takakiae]